MQEPAGGDGRSPRERSIPWLTAAAVVAACYVTGLVVNNLTASGQSLFGVSLSSVVNTLFPHVDRGRLDTASLEAVWADVRSQYFVRNLDPSKLSAATERGLVDELKSEYGDRFTTFFSGDQFAQLQQGLQGRRSASIGVALEARCSAGAPCPPGTKPAVIVFEDVLTGQPAARAGLANGDVLLRIGGRDVATLGVDVGTRIQAVSDIVHHSAGRPVSLTVQRGATTVTVTPVPADLTIPSVYSQRLGAQLYVQITGFDRGTGVQLTQQLRDGLARGAAGVVLDLRGNPGGLVDEAQSVASQFLQRIPGTQEVVVIRRGRLAAANSPASAQQVEDDPILSGGVAPHTPLVVLVDENSASAAEIVASALRDYRRGVLVGEKTFGKGSVQVDFQLPDHNDLHLTIQRWFSPHGASIDGVGITPDHVVALSSPDAEFRADTQGAPAASDAQLQAALAALPK